MKVLNKDIMKRLICFIICFEMIIWAFPASAVSNTDKPSGWAKAKVLRAISLGIVPKELQGEYTEPITREEFVSLFVTSVFVYQKNEINHAMDSIPSQNTTREMYLDNVKVVDYSFKDTDSEDVKLAYMMGLVNGTSDTTFLPDSPLKREEVAAMLVNYCNDILDPAGFSKASTSIKDINDASEWARDSIALAWAQGIYFDGLQFDNGIYEKKRKTTEIIFDPKACLTREQAIVVIMNIYKSYMPIYRFVMLRGKVNFGKSMLKLKWEVSRNSVTCLAFKDEKKFSDSTDSIFAQWRYWSNTSITYPRATPEQVLAAYGGDNQRSSMYPEEIVKCGATGIHAVFDMGYAEYEIHNQDYIFQFRFKGNGTYSEKYNYYSGDKKLPIPYIRIV